MWSKNIKTTTGRIFSYLSCIMILAILTSCASSVEKEIDEADNVTIKILKIRDLTFQGRYGLAEKMYQKIQLEYPDDPEIQVTLDYEIAFLYIKREKYKEARPLFEAIVNKYELDENSNQISQWPNYLSQKMIANIDEELSKPTILERITPRRWRKNTDDI